MAEHSVTLKLPGNPASLLPRLVAALKELDYVVLHEQPLLARRKARKLGSVSTNVLNYSMSLTVGLKALGTEATEATFFYEWRSSWGSIGDKPTLTKEAEALAALALLHLKQTVCTSCGREQSAEAKFCRSCGQALASTVPAEVEMLKLMSAANAAAKSNSFHITVGIVVLLMLPVAMLMTQKPVVFFWFGLLMSFIFWLSSLFAGSRLIDAISAKLTKTNELLAPPADQQVQLGPDTAKAQLPPALPFVTEATTHLLKPAGQRQAEPLPVPKAAPKYDTGEL